MSLINSALNLGSLTAGAYYGFCHAKGVPVESEFALKYGPAIIQATYFGLVGGIKGCIEGGLAGAAIGGKDGKSLQALVGGATGSFAGTVLAGGTGLVVGGLKGGVITLIGYVVGNVAGHIF